MAHRGVRWTVTERGRRSIEGVDEHSTDPSRYAGSTASPRGSTTNLDTCLELWSIKFERAEKLTGLRRYIVSALYRIAYHVPVITINYDYNHILHFQHVPSLIITQIYPDLPGLPSPTSLPSPHSAPPAASSPAAQPLAGLSIPSFRPCTSIRRWASGS